MIEMPSIIVLIVCKTIAGSGPVDQNAEWTGHENRVWAYEHSMMQCRRQQIQVYDQAVDNGAAPQPFNRFRCLRSGIGLAIGFDMKAKNTPWRFWKIACPVPIINTITKEVIAWKIPECGNRETVHCEGDTEI